MSELELYFAYQQEGKLDSIDSTELGFHKIWFENLEKLYKLQDTCIQRLIEELTPEHCIITSDHGAVPYLYKADFNDFLFNYGYQKQKVTLRGTVKNLAKALLKQRTFRIAKELDYQESQAFANWYLSGIFINDKRRFAGPVREEDINKVVDQICSDFNQTKEAKHYEMKAKPYRKLYSDAKYYDYLADIKIHCPETIFSAPDKGKFIRRNEDYAPLPNLDSVKGGMHTGQKGKHPLFCCDLKTASLIQENDPLDLTLVYKLTKRIFCE
jgi:predicted AlkP superfamily phosphohydrolase/phosphomutase